jgi:hypothetical protein
VLNYSVFVSEIRPIVIADLPPNTGQRTWSPISATLISGASDAVLVDPLMTIEDGRALAEWVAGTGKDLIAIYSTHGHGADSQALSACTLPGHAGSHTQDAATGLARKPRLVLEATSPRPDSE